VLPPAAPRTVPVPWPTSWNVNQDRNADVVDSHAPTVE
jgi:hypothetical protein